MRRHQKHILLEIFILIILVPVFLLPAIHTAYGADTTAEWIKKGDNYFEMRAADHDGAWASTVPVTNALSAYLKAYELGDRSAELITKILQASYFYARYAEKERDKQKEVLQKGIDIGEEAIKKYSDDTALNYEMSVCWGRWGVVNGIFASAMKGVANKIRKYAEKTIKLDPDYAEGGGYRVMGRLHFMAPRIPLILSWPSKEESLKYLKKAVNVGSDNPTNHFYFAESLYHTGSYKEALIHLDIVLKAKLNTSKQVCKTCSSFGRIGGEIEYQRVKKLTKRLKEKILSEHSSSHTAQGP
jgi:tetratricopeptide (TPR) repeat protein